MPWTAKFENPFNPPNGKPLVTLRDAANYIALPKKEAAAPEWQTAMEVLISTAERFIALLCHKEMQAWREDSSAAAICALEQQRDFLDAHLLMWAPQFWTTVKAQAQHDFYRALAALAHDAITEDRALLEETLVEFDAA